MQRHPGNNNSNSNHRSSTSIGLLLLPPRLHPNAAPMDQDRVGAGAAPSPSHDPKGRPQRHPNESQYSGSSSSLAADDQQESYIFIPFSRESFLQLQLREEELKRKADEKKNKPREGRLVDGELKFDDDEGDEPVLTRDQLLVEGNVLPATYGEVPSKLRGIPLEEIDPYITEKVRDKFSPNTIFLLQCLPSV